jgi:spermidine dehydrogenase
MAITRRDFLNGIALTGAGWHLAPRDVLAAASVKHLEGSAYPPARQGMRGSHRGSFEVFHSLAMEDRRWARPDKPVDDRYDLVVVGGGISGLAAAWFWQQQAGENARILILDNHDDFGGHAKRNEFTVDGKTLIGYGGSQSIDTPSGYSRVARQLIESLGIDTEKFRHWYDRDFVKRHGLGSHWYFDKANFGRDVLLPNPLGAAWLGIPAAEPNAAWFNQLPITATSRRDLKRLLEMREPPVSWLSPDAALSHLRSRSYEAWLSEDLGIDSGVVQLLRRRACGLWGVGYDALSALEAARAGEPGTHGLGLDQWLWGDAEDEPYIFHFPDGNATIARLLVRELIPGAVSGQTAEDLVTAGVDYARLDKPGTATRLRLNATAINVQHTDVGDSVEVTYVRDGIAERVVADKAVMACYNHVLPWLCPELPEAQVSALQWPEKVPLVYINVALRNWRAFASAGLYHFEAISDRFVYGCLDFPVSTPGYAFSASPDEPILLHLVHSPIAPGHPPREQFRRGRAEMLGLSFADYERDIRRQLSGMLGGHGFDFDRDVAGITVNRWPHGYAYEYIDLHDPSDWTPDKGPHITARQPWGRVAIANSDSEARAYADAAIDAAWRAVGELQSSQS